MSGTQAKKQKSDKRKPNVFRIELGGNSVVKERILNKLRTVKEKLGQKWNVTNTEAMETLLDFWLGQNNGRS